MNKEFFAKQKKPLVLLAAVVVLIVVLALVTGGKGKQAEQNPLEPAQQQPSGENTPQALTEETAKVLVQELIGEMQQTSALLLQFDIDQSQEINASTLGTNTAAQLAFKTTAEVNEMKENLATVSVDTIDMKAVMEQAFAQTVNEYGEDFEDIALAAAITDLVQAEDVPRQQKTVTVPVVWEDGRYKLERTRELLDALMGGLVDYYDSLLAGGDAQ